MHLPARIVDRARRGDQRLTGDLAAEHSLTALVGRPAAEDVDLDGFEVEQLDEIVEGGHVVILAQPIGTNWRRRERGDRGRHRVPTPPAADRPRRRGLDVALPGLRRVLQAVEPGQVGMT